MCRVKSSIYRFKGRFHYGHVTLRRERCSKCGSYSLVVDGWLQCCNVSVAEEKAQPRHYRVVEGGPRKRPSKTDRDRILADQDGCCVFCGRRFGSVVWRADTPLILAIQWDHLDPWVRSRNNQSDNFAAACQVCNNFKQDMIFATIEEAAVWICQRWAGLGIRDSSVGT